MKIDEYFEELISGEIRKQLFGDGVLFSLLRRKTDAPQDLVAAIYRYWRTGIIRIERNWNGIGKEPKKLSYSNSACLLPDDRLFLNVAASGNLWTAATWNVNSIRTRLPLLLKWLEEQNPDVVCLQETKAEDIQFPTWELRQAGYESVSYGQKSYNGVAILAKHPIKNVRLGFRNGYDAENARLIAGTVCGVRLINVYVPQGQSTTSEKFQYKLNFFAELLRDLQAEKNPRQPFAIMGDFNIAPQAKDIYDVEKMRNKVSFHPQEHALLAKLTGQGLSDLFRKFDSRSGQFSWWDFRTQGFERGEGMRIDYILANSVLASSCQTCRINIETRTLDKPSDHAPVIGEFKL